MSHTLVLNADWTPLGLLPVSVMNWQDAVKAIYLGTVRSHHEYENWTVHSPSRTFSVPSVVITTRYIKVRRSVAFTPELVFLRDGFQCQYCGGKFRSGDLTVDHVVPKSKGGPRNFQNLVAACSPCNSKRGNNVSIKPKRAPYRPSYHELVGIAQRLPLTIPHESWVAYIGWDESKLTISSPHDEPGYLPKSMPKRLVDPLIATEE